MIIKSYETNKLDINKYNFILLHGDNEGAKKELILSTISANKDKKVINYEEKQILENTDDFFNEILSKSFFDEAKILVIKRPTNKIFSIIEEIYLKKIDEVFIIINSAALDKKSKLRNFFEKQKDIACIAFYPDSPKILSNLASQFFRKKNILISQSNINLIVNRCNGDREVFYNELKKIELYTLNKSKISDKEIASLTNLIENHDISELINYCLAKNKQKTFNILNENNFSNEDSILIIRTFLNKSKKVLILSDHFEKSKNIELTLASAKPPIFWKDKEITKEQIYNWNKQNLKKLIYTLNKLELDVKKNINNSINLVTDFVLNQVSSISNN